jgi:hypothetical protein
MLESKHPKSLNRAHSEAPPETRGAAKGYSVTRADDSEDGVPRPYSSFPLRRKQRGLRPHPGPPVANPGYEDVGRPSGYAAAGAEASRPGRVGAYSWE